jgi:hypothetical protein
MKRFMTALILLLSSGAHAAVGCIDNSYHMHNPHFYENIDPSIRSSFSVLRNEKVRPTDFKVWQPVNCNCPCEHYRGYYLKKETEATGYCVECKHRGNPSRTSEQNIETDHEELAQQFALFIQ